MSIFLKLFYSENNFWTSKYDLIKENILFEKKIN